MKNITDKKEEIVMKKKEIDSKPENLPKEENKEQFGFSKQLAFLDELNNYIDKKAKEIADSKEKDLYESEKTNEINAALSKAQSEFPEIGPNRQNPYFKSNYTDLYEIMKNVRPALSKNGLSITQQTKIQNEGATILVTKLRHTSGQFIETRARVIPAKNDAQTYGSALTYMKRYSLISLLNITVSKDPSDDDAEVQMADARQIIAKGPSIKYNPKEEAYQPISKEQLEELEYELEEYPDIGEEIMDRMQLQSLADMPKSKYLVSLKRVREIKNLRNGLTSP